MSVERVSNQAPCAVCGGHGRLPHGQGVRCIGRKSADGKYAICTREELAGGIEGKANTAGILEFAHRLAQRCQCTDRCHCGDVCWCGTLHGDAVAHEAWKRSGNAPSPARRITAPAPPQRPAPKQEPKLRVIADDEWARFVAVYEYLTDEPTPRRMRVVRTKEKLFFPALQSREDGTWIGWGMQGLPSQLYRRDELSAGVAAGDPVYIAEGEKDVDALRAAGLVATCNSGGAGVGAGKFRFEFAKHFAGADVTIVQDKDDPGRAHAKNVAAMLKDVAKSVRIVEAKSGKDAHDHLAAGYAPSDFVPIWPAESIRKVDPVRWKRKLLAESLEIGDPFADENDINKTLSLPEPPSWHTGLYGGAFPLEKMSGWTVVAGQKGSAKSYLTMSSSLSAALYDEFEVFYVNAEIEPWTIAKRIAAFDGGRPEHWHNIRARFGCSIPSLIEHLSPKLTTRKTLIVMDSMNSFLDQAATAPNGRDPMGMADNRRLSMWLMNLVNESNGQISVMTVSEMSANGGVKFRVADYKGTVILGMTSSESDNAVKTIEIMKHRNKPGGESFDVRLDWKRCRFVSVNSET